MSSIYVHDQKDPMQPRVSLSVVSHAQGDLIERLLQSLAQHKPPMPIEVILTENIPERMGAQGKTLPFPVRVVHNTKPLGFAANHNQAFEFAQGEYFALINPDIIFSSDVLSPLVALLETNQADIVAPLVVNPDGDIQDSYRPLPTPFSLFLRRIRITSVPRTEPPTDLVQPDWIAAMFLLMRRSTYLALGGMDSRYHLYFEDVDFSCRARLAGYSLAVDPFHTITHDAQRMSRRNPAFALQHCISALRFFTSETYRQYKSRLRNPISS